MAKILTERQLYKAKVEWFKENEYEEIEPLDFTVKYFQLDRFKNKGI